MDSYTTLIFLHQSRVSYTISYTKRSARRRSNADVYVLLVPHDPLQGSRLRRTTTCRGSTLNGEGVSRFHSLTHLSEPIRTFFPKSSRFPTPFPTPKVCGMSRTPTHDSEQPISRGNSVWSISRRAQSGRFRKAQKRQSTGECPANREF